MSAATVLKWLAEHAPDLRLIEHSRSTATVAEAAEVIGVEPGRIAKTLALRVGEEIMLVVTRGDARLDNGLCRPRWAAVRACSMPRPRWLPPAMRSAGSARSVWPLPCRLSPTDPCWSILQCSLPLDRAPVRSKSNPSASPN